MNPDRHITEEVVRPESEHLLILDERRHVFTGLIHIEPVDCVVQYIGKRCRRKTRFAAPVTGLSHPLFEMAKIQLGMVGGIPDKIVPIATL